MRPGDRSMKIVVIGANGQLGCDVCAAFSAAGHEVIPLNHNTADIAVYESIKAPLAQARPDVIVNTAAMHNVDACEADPVRSFEVNGIGARNLALIANELDATLFYLSTDYVFDGLKKAPYVETDYPIPLNAYGNSKLAGESFIRSISKKHFVLRVSGLYGNNPCRAKGGNNFVKLMLKLSKERDEIRVVDDEALTPTFTEDVARQIVAMTGMDAYGLYHATAQGGCSWYRFASKIFELSSTQIKLSIAGSNEFPMKVPRPKYSVLENAGLKALGMDLMPDWQDGLRRYLAILGALKG
jgi:dTDP-4-dehydrorhamnose reductase